MNIIEMSIEIEYCRQITIFEYINGLKLAHLKAFYAYYPDSVALSFAEFFDNEIYIFLN